MLGSPRGVWLEEALTKLLFLRNNIDIVAMSATIANMEELGQVSPSLKVVALLSLSLPPPPPSFFFPLFVNC